MKITRGKDGRYCAEQLGAMGRLELSDSHSIGEAMHECASMLEHQVAECYAHEQSMTALSLALYGEPKQ